ncbi:MAG: hypothetical protein KDB27_22875 [Planctomycetales bacterium]|nr:hypothetical protein [Planctomycetales bacterium]
MRHISLLFVLQIMTAMVAVNLAGVQLLPAQDANADRVQPYSQNPRYWQYKARPVMLLGGSKTDHLFLLDDLEAHLDELKSIGVNYVRNTMSQREGWELKAHKLRPDGKFDLDEWNDDYWNRFANMLRWTADRDIIVQVEIWDRFDFTDAREWNIWQESPWRPANNSNYTTDESGLADRYTDHPGADKQPFFHTIPGMPMYEKRLDQIRNYQEAFVEKMLSYSLAYGNVLYCMNNETSTPPEWGQYWIRFIKERANSKGVLVCTSDMFDDAFAADKAKHTPVIFDDGEKYMFADISQVNSQIYDDEHWKRLQLLLRLVDKHPRPTNHVKIYSGGFASFGTGSLEDGVERFWRDILGGSAAVRFHRPPENKPFDYRTKSCIRAARLMTTMIAPWELAPHMELLSDRSNNEAYLAANPGQTYALYFTHGGSVGLDLTDTPGVFGVKWISVSERVTTRTTSAKVYARTKDSIEGGRVVTLSAPYKGGWVAVLVKK